MKKRICLLFLAFSINFYSQVTKEQDQQEQVQEAKYCDEKLGYSELLKRNRETIFFMIQRAWLANQSLSYLGLLPKNTPLGERRIPLRQREGEYGNGFSLFEAKFALELPLFLGKAAYGSAREKLQQVTFDYETNFRMTLDCSFPLTTPNQDFGFSWKINLFNSVSNSICKLNKKCFLDPEFRVTELTEDVHFYNLKLSARHYSNGQSGSSTYEDTATGERRNNYIDGNFSTNYISIALTKGIYKMPTKTLHQWSLKYRMDGGVGGALSFDRDQENAYGKNRIGLMYDYRSGLKQNGMHKNFYYHVRSEFEYIMGNLDNFNANLVNDTKKYRLSASLIGEVSPLSQRHISFFAKMYYGRDYLNIRYDDIIFTSMVGIRFDIQKYFVPKIY